ncbi:uncharacterized protein K452DRAFT_236089, partial [Aplosporella prunicola CBS 121167]
ITTNNLPGCTCRGCQALCKEACVLEINEDPELACAIFDRTSEMRWMAPSPPKDHSDKKIAIIGCGLRA